MLPVWVRGIENGSVPVGPAPQWARAHTALCAAIVILGFILILGRVATS